MAIGNALNLTTSGLVSADGLGSFTGRTLTAGNTGVTISNGDGISGNPTISVNAGGFPTTDVTGGLQTLAVNNRYVTNRGGGVTYTLPATATEGDEIKIVGKTGLWTVNWTTNQQINLGSVSATLTTGTIVSTDAGDCVTITCTTGGASTIWRATSMVGNITYT